MDYFDWGPFFVNPEPKDPGHICYQCGKPGARVQHTIQADYERIPGQANAWRVREGAPVRFKCQTIRDCATQEVK